MLKAPGGYPKIGNRTRIRGKDGQGNRKPLHLLAAEEIFLQTSILAIELQANHRDSHQVESHDTQIQWLHQSHRISPAMFPKRRTSFDAPDKIPAVSRLAAA